MSSQTLDADQILKTLRRLEQRIAERFPERGLLLICRDLINIGEQAQQRSTSIAKPNLALRAFVLIAIVAAIDGLVVVGISINVPIGTPEIFGAVQGIEAAANIVVLLGAALFFLISLETRLKRNR